MILCSGNPTHQTVASAVNRLYPNSAFMSRSNGYNFSTWSIQVEELFKRAIVKHTTFINSSYIAPGVQNKLLEAAYQEWMCKDIKGHIINIGTTAEWSDNNLHKEYILSKQALRARSLELNDLTGITGVKTSYIIVGGINDGKPGTEKYLNVSAVAHAIDWIIKNPNRIALLQIESVA